MNYEMKNKTNLRIANMGVQIPTRHAVKNHINLRIGVTRAQNLTTEMVCVIDKGLDPGPHRGSTRERIQDQGRDQDQEEAGQDRDLTIDAILIVGH